MTKHPHLIFMAFPNRACALDAVNTLGTELDILEFGASHNQNITLLASAKDNLLKNYAGPLTDSLYLESPQPELLKAYFHQQSVNLKSHLLVLESPQMSLLLSTCNTLLKTTKFELIDFVRGSSDNLAAAYLANDSTSDVSTMIPKEIIFKLIPNPAKNLLNLFN